jgi:hypothetical protein
MMPVPLPAKPLNFDERVWMPGLHALRFLHQNPDDPPPNEHFWKTPHQSIDGSWRKTLDYWTRARDDLCEGYNKRCVYSCFVIEPTRDSSGQLKPKAQQHSIDHFAPKSLNPARKAFEWSNLRWCWNVINNNKNNSCISIDPTQLTDMVVELEEDARGKWMVIPARNLTESTSNDVQDTIKKLGLNSRIVEVKRTGVANDFINNKHGYTDQEMTDRQPFVFHELRRLRRI